MVDTYKTDQPEKNLIKYALFISFFPHSIAGPLVKSKRIINQLSSVHINKSNIVIAGTIIIIGLFKKTCIADNLAPCVELVFNSINAGITPSFAEVWFSSLCYTIQLYFDFSGYSDIAVGLARLFNIYFPINFNSPYKASSIIEFWRRWNITLSHFLRDYLYIPLGGSKNGEFSKYRNILITMLIAGIWHGANWTFIIWGLLHGLCLIVNHIWRKVTVKFKLKFVNNKSYKLFSWMITMLMILIGWVIFRADNMNHAIILLGSMFGMNTISVSPLLKSLSLSLDLKYDGFFNNELFYFLDYLPLLLTSVLVVLLLPNTNSFMINYHNYGNSRNLSNNRLSNIKWLPNKKYAILLALLSWSVIISTMSYKKAEFLYFNF